VLFWSWEPPASWPCRCPRGGAAQAHTPATRSDQLWQAARATAQPDFPTRAALRRLRAPSPGSSNWRQPDRRAAPMAWIHRHHRGEDTTPLGGQPAAELLLAVGPRAYVTVRRPRRLSPGRPPSACAIDRAPPRQPLPGQSPHRADGRTWTRWRAASRSTMGVLMRERAPSRRYGRPRSLAGAPSIARGSSHYVSAAGAVVLDHRQSRAWGDRCRQPRPC
jgi:hypothetical protein